MYVRDVLIVVYLFLPNWSAALFCSRFPANTLTPKSPVDENFAILINNNPQTYILGQEYNITLNAYNGHRFISFSLALENDNGFFSLNGELGQFKISDPIETRFSPNCINMVESTNTHPKIRSEVTWIAPTNPNSGCVLIRATLLQHRDVWHMDDGGLTRRICQEIVDEVENRRSYDAQECCACDEARYELSFQGVWNRNHHPKDFPSKGWITRFGDIIGAAHTFEYHFWKDGELASQGMKEYAEHGSSRVLEDEFNSQFQKGDIRTIIKARGPAFPNLNGISVATVRVDQKHHLISLASKIDPSPDWFVGISGMELCMANCTWLEERVIQLYPWDAGTDAGPSYTSPDQPQLPPDVIRRMRSNFPNDPRSPFYDETGAAMAPLATLVVKRQRVFERTCEDKDSNNENIPRECHTHPWTPWSECSASCGEGHTFRTRVYKKPELAKVHNCDDQIPLREDRICQHKNCNDPDVVQGAEENFGDDIYQQNLPDSLGNENYEGNEGYNQYNQYNTEDNENEIQDENENEFENENEAERTEFEVGNLQRANLGDSYRGSNDKNNRQSGRQFEQQKNYNNQWISEQLQDDIPELLVPGYCFQKLHVYNCLDPTVVQNSWFYNYCEDECMLYAEDRCDRNENKFSSLETCESMCRRPQNAPYLRYVQDRTCRTTDNKTSKKRAKNSSWKMK